MEISIIIKNNKRILINTNKEIDISDGEIIKYEGIYYKKINDIIETIEISTIFIGIVETHRSEYNTGIIGIYIKPLYIFNILNNEWNKIINYESPKTKYFLYPHLLILPDADYNYHPLKLLHTCEIESLNNFINITKTFSL